MIRAGLVLGGLLVLRWRHGEELLDSGIRTDDKAGFPAWIHAVAEVAGGGWKVAS